MLTHLRENKKAQSPLELLNTEGKLKFNDSATGNVTGLRFEESEVLSHTSVVTPPKNQTKIYIKGNLDYKIRTQTVESYFHVHEI